MIGKDLDRNDVLYVGTTDGKLIALDTSDGSELWQRDLGYIPGRQPTIVSTPAVSEDRDIE